MSRSFRDFAALAQSDPATFRELPPSEVLDSARHYLAQGREELRRRHDSGESGLAIVHGFTDLADTLVVAATHFAVASSGRPWCFDRRAVLVAHGSYGRRELNPFSDLDLSIVHSPRADRGLKAVVAYLAPFFWDIGIENSVVIRSLREVKSLAASDLAVYTSYLHARRLFGDEHVFGELRYRIDALDGSRRPKEFNALLENAASVGADRHSRLYDPEPDIKTGMGGLRDYHTAMWIFAAEYGAFTLDDAAGRELVTEDDVLQLDSAVAFLWRIRNEMHFQAGRRSDKLTFEDEAHTAVSLGYTTSEDRDSSRFMEDYYRAAGQVRSLLHRAARSLEPVPSTGARESGVGSAEFVLVNGLLEAGEHDARWFDENPQRLMSVFWESARRRTPLGPRTLDRVREHLALVNESFQRSELARRFFVALCSHPLEAGSVLRQAAESGLLGHYLPEFAAVGGIVRYEDFHHYPVDEHTLRALEALAAIPGMDGRVGKFLGVAIDHLSDPYVLVLAVLFHDLGKAKGDEHSEEGARLAREIGERIGLPEEDVERIAFLVEHHLLMTHTALYRDVDDPDVVEKFARTMKSEQRLRALLLLSYADLSAVGPNVWTDWKGSLLLTLYMRAERVLRGHADVADEAYWEGPKVEAVEALLEDPGKSRVRPHVQDLGAHYLAAYAIEAIADHLKCLDRARSEGVAVALRASNDADTTEVVVCAPDRPGIFGELTGCFVSQSAAVKKAALFTCSDGMALDSFRVVRSVNGKCLTEGEMRSLQQVLVQVLSGEKTVETFIEQGRRRVFALLHPPAPVRTEVRFDNDSSRNYTVVDVFTGDRAGLLYDMAKAFHERGVNVSSARIVTDARRIRDAFYITIDDKKIENATAQAEIEKALRGAILGKLPASSPLQKWRESEVE